MPSSRLKPTPRRVSFADAVAKAVRAIPRGEVRSYAQIALYAGYPGAARGVGRELKTLTNVPWWRVVRADGSLAAGIASEQRERLEAEGVRFKGTAEHARVVREKPRRPAKHPGRGSRA